MSTEKATEIRKTLKQQHGWTSRQVSVRASRCSVSSAIDVLIKDPVVSEVVVRQVATQYERIDWDERTQCILSGGNTFVDVEWSDEVLDSIAARLELDQAPTDGHEHVRGLIRAWTCDGGTTWEWSIDRAEGQTWEDHNDQDHRINEALRDGGARLFHVYGQYNLGRTIARVMLHLGRDLDSETPDEIEKAA